MQLISQLDCDTMGAKTSCFTLYCILRPDRHTDEPYNSLSRSLKSPVLSVSRDQTHGVHCKLYAIMVIYVKSRGKERVLNLTLFDQDVPLTLSIKL